MRQLILDLLPNPLPTFENFVTGDNAATLTALAAWLGAATPQAPFFLWGEAGVGKSHLLQASEMNYCDAAVDPHLASLASLQESCAVDSVDQLSERGQLALFRLIHHLRDQGCLLVAARLAPIHLRLREDLRTRLGSGVVYRLRALRDDDTLAALSDHAHARGMRLPTEVITYLFRHAPRDMRSLCTLLTTLDRWSIEQQRPVTIPLVREILHHASRP